MPNKITTYARKKYEKTKAQPYSPMQLTHKVINKVNLESTLYHLYIKSGKTMPQTTLYKEALTAHS